jgi:hypothetical protein
MSSMLAIGSFAFLRHVLEERGGGEAKTATLGRRAAPFPEASGREAGVMFANMRAELI